MNSFEYRITNQVFDWMSKGTKRIEVRIYNEKSSKINLGDIITFVTVPDCARTLKVKVIGLLRYPNIWDLYNDFGMDLIAAKMMTKEKIQAIFEEIFGKEEVAKHDILGIKFELLEINDNTKSI